MIIRLLIIISLLAGHPLMASAGDIPFPDDITAPSATTAAAGVELQLVAPDGMHSGCDTLSTCIAGHCCAAVTPPLVSCQSFMPRFSPAGVNLVYKETDLPTQIKPPRISLG